MAQQRNDPLINEANAPTDSVAAVIPLIKTFEPALLPMRYVSHVYPQNPPTAQHNIYGTA